MAVFQQPVDQGLVLGRWDLPEAQPQPGDAGLLAALDRQAVVRQIGRQGRQHVLDRPAALEGWVQHVALVDDLAQVAHPLQDARHPGGVARLQGSQLFQARLFEALVPDQDGAVLAQIAGEAFQQRRARVESIARQECAVAQLAVGAVQAVQRVLEDHVLVRMVTVEGRHGGVAGLEIQEVERLFQAGQGAPQIRAVDVQRLALRQSHHLSLFVAEREIIRRVAGLQDAAPAQLGLLLGAQARDIVDRKLGQPGMADIRARAVLRAAAGREEIRLRLLQNLQGLLAQGARLRQGFGQLVVDFFYDEKLVQADLAAPHIALVGVHDEVILDLERRSPAVRRLQDGGLESHVEQVLLVDARARLDLDQVVAPAGGLEEQGVQARLEGPVGDLQLPDQLAVGGGAVQLVQALVSQLLHLVTLLDQVALELGQLGREQAVLERPQVARRLAEEQEVGLAEVGWVGHGMDSGGVLGCGRGFGRRSGLLVIRPEQLQALVEAAALLAPLALGLLQLRLRDLEGGLDGLHHFQQVGQFGQ